MTKTALSPSVFLTTKISRWKLLLLIMLQDHSADILRKEYPQITLIENKINVGFGRANNQALPYLNSRYVLLLNTDAFVETDTIAKTVQYLDANPPVRHSCVKYWGVMESFSPHADIFLRPGIFFLKKNWLDRIFKRTKMVDDMSWDHASVRDCDWYRLFIT